MKFPLVSRKLYDEMKLEKIKAQKALEEYKEKETLEIIQWAVKVEDYEDLLIIYATHVQINMLSPMLFFMDNENLVGAFNDVDFYIRYGSYDLEESYLNENDV